MTELESWDEVPYLHGLTEDGSVIERVLPTGWEAPAKTLKALCQTKGVFKEARPQRRVRLIHLSDGCSLRETAARACAGGLACVSEGALLKRLRRCGAWFQWLVAPLSQRLIGSPLPTFPGQRIRLVDASVVCEPGATWRLPYALDLSNFSGDEVHVSSVSQGESFIPYPVRPGEGLIADRGRAGASRMGWLTQGR